MQDQLSSSPGLGAARLDDALSAGLIIEPGMGGRASPFALDPVVHKADVALGQGELERQLRLARWYLDHDRWLSTLIVLREWLVSWVLDRQPWENAGWLTAHVRRPVEHYLDSLAYRARLGVADPTEQGLAVLWGDLRRMRAPLDIGGMSPTACSVTRPAIEDALAACERLALQDGLDDGYVPPRGRLVITPLGLSPGVLYAVARLLHPTHTVIVSSDEALLREAETLQVAGVPDLPRTVRSLADPFHCFEQGAILADDPAIRGLILEHEEVVVNLTGGTTAMQYVIERLGRESRALGKRTRTIALIDRRSPDEQRAQPFTEGELVWLDDLEVGDGSGEH